MNDAVLTVHLNPHGCGVAKFNLLLAEHLGVPCYQIGTRDADACQYPLVSIHPRELFGAEPVLPARYDLFLHSPFENGRGFRTPPQRVLIGNATIPVPLHYPTPEILWCPSTLRGAPERGGIRILTFGMAGRSQTRYLQQLRAVLKATGTDYSINLSCAVHEGASWDRTMGEAWAHLSAIFGAHARFLGYLFDDALITELRRASGVALFYDPAVRANNTTLWAAFTHGVPVITNLDSHSPTELVHASTVFDIDALREWPTPDVLRMVRFGGAQLARRYSWERLVTMVQQVPVPIGVAESITS